MSESKPRASRPFGSSGRSRGRVDYLDGQSAILATGVTARPRLTPRRTMTHLDLALIFLLFLLNFLIRFLRHFSRIWMGTGRVIRRLMGQNEMEWAGGRGKEETTISAVSQDDRRSSPPASRGTDDWRLTHVGCVFMRKVRS